VSSESSPSDLRMGTAFHRGPKAALAAAAALLSGLAAALLTVLALQRHHLPYNSEGRYFDPVSSVVYKQQVVEVLALAATLAWSLTAALGFIWWRLAQRRPAR
jgi:hypothetical protein